MILAGIIAFIISIAGWLVNFLKYIFGWLMYAIAVPLMWLLDFVQTLFRKLAGLGTTYYQTGSGGAVQENKSDMLLGLFTNKVVLQTLAGMAIFAVCLLLIATVVQMIRVQYTTEGAKNSPSTIIGSALKAISLFVIVPVACLLGIFISNYLLKALDAATNASGATTMSGQIFISAAADANKVANGGEYWAIDMAHVEINGGGNTVIHNAKYDASNLGVGTFADPDGYFKIASDLGSEEKNRLAIAEKIDNIFASGSEISMYFMGTKGYRALGGAWFVSLGGLYSYDNPAAVTYFYDCGAINYVVLYSGLVIAIWTLFKSCFGLVKRFYKATVLFVISPGVIALYPLDNGNAYNQWRKSFIGTVLAAYGTVVALNLYFTIAGAMKYIYLFDPVNSTNGVMLLLNRTLNYLCQAIFVIVGALMVGEISSMISNFIGADDAAKEGGDMAKSVGGAVGKAAKGVAMVAGGGAALAMKVGKGIKQANGNKKEGNRLKEEKGAIDEQESALNQKYNAEEITALKNEKIEDLSEEQKTKLADYNTEKGALDTKKDKFKNDSNALASNKVFGKQGKLMAATGGKIAQLGRRIKVATGITSQEQIDDWAASDNPEEKAKAQKYATAQMQNSKTAAKINGSTSSLFHGATGAVAGYFGHPFKDSGKAATDAAKGQQDNLDKLPGSKASKAKAAAEARDAAFERNATADGQAAANLGRQQSLMSAGQIIINHSGEIKTSADNIRTKKQGELDDLQNVMRDRANQMSELAGDSNNPASQMALAALNAAQNKDIKKADNLQAEINNANVTATSEVLQQQTGSSKAEADKLAEAIAAQPIKLDDGTEVNINPDSRIKTDGTVKLDDPEIKSQLETMADMGRRYEQQLQKITATTEKAGRKGNQDASNEEIIKLLNQMLGKLGGNDKGGKK